MTDVRQKPASLSVGACRGEEGIAWARSRLWIPDVGTIHAKVRTLRQPGGRGAAAAS